MSLSSICPSNMPVRCSHVPFVTQWCHKRLKIDSLGQIAQFCLWQLSEWNMPQGPTENKVFPSVKSAAVTRPEEDFPLIWLLWSGICQTFSHNSWPLLMASGKSPGQKLHPELFSFRDQMNSVWHEVNIWTISLLLQMKQENISDCCQKRVSALNGMHISSDF